MIVVFLLVARYLKLSNIGSGQYNTLIGDQKKIPEAIRATPKKKIYSRKDYDLEYIW